MTGGSNADQDQGAAKGGDQPNAAEREYYFLQQRVGEYHRYCLEMKKWSVAGASAVAVAGQAASLDPLPVYAVMTALALAFWVTEAAWRVDQWVFIRMIQDMEATNPTLPSVGRRWVRFARGAEEARRVRKKPQQSWKSARGEFTALGLVRHMVRFRALLPHALIVMIGIGLMTGAAAGAFKRDRVDAQPARIEVPAELQHPPQGNRQ